MKKVLLTLIVIAIASALMAMPLPGKEEALKIFKQINSFKINAENTRLQNPMCIYEDNMDNNEWAYVGKYVYEYENNQVANVVYNRLGQIEEETVLIPFMRYHYTYSNGKISIISMEMNANMMDPEGEPLWIALMSMYYQYNNQNHLTMMYMAATDMETGEMIIGSRVHFVYENNRVHSVVNFEIDEETEEVMYDKSVVEYDANGRAIQMIAYSSPDSSSWTQYEKTVMTYDPTDTSNYDTFQNIVDNSNYMQIGFNYNFGTARVNNEMTYS